MVVHVIVWISSLMSTLLPLLTEEGNMYLLEMQKERYDMIFIYAYLLRLKASGIQWHFYDVIFVTPYIPCISTFPDYFSGPCWLSTQVMFLRWRSPKVFLDILKSINGPPMSGSWSLIDSSSDGSFRAIFGSLLQNKVSRSECTILHYWP